jgi:Spy/CpxP family protein refolding chaperone
MSGTLRTDFAEEFPVLRLSIGAIALVAALAAPFAVSAQSAPAPAAGQAAPANGAGHHHRHGNRYMRAMRGLNLSDTQKTQIRGIMQSAHQARIAGGPAADPQTRRQNTIALHQQIEGVLTDTQRAQLHASLRAQRQANKANGTAPQAPPNN